jgi:hypothetical protein
MTLAGYGNLEIETESLVNEWSAALQLGHSSAENARCSTAEPQGRGGKATEPKHWDFLGGLGDLDG